MLHILLAPALLAAQTAETQPRRLGPPERLGLPGPDARQRHDAVRGVDGQRRRGEHGGGGSGSGGGGGGCERRDWRCRAGGRGGGGGGEGGGVVGGAGADGVGREVGRRAAAGW